MVKLTKIYTRGGDGGKTSLADGRRLPKDHPRIAAIGAVDEANAAIGLARLHTDAEAERYLSRVQQDFFDLGADLARPWGEDKEDSPPLRMTAGQVERLEHEIDEVNAQLSPLESFVLPGGSAAASHLHLARTIVRRAERLIITLNTGQPLNPALLQYINRLSDHLFVLARKLNNDGRDDVLWVPGANLGD